MHNGKPCGRPLYHRDKCICHSEMEAKNIQLFQKELDKIFADEKAEFYDLTRFIFPVHGLTLPTPEAYALPIEYGKDTYFDHAQFLGNADFFGVKFSGNAHFCRTEFLGSAIFYVTKFLGDTDFTGAQFRGLADFSVSRFAGKADFRDADFSKEGRFRSTLFKRWVDFSGCVSREGCRLFFNREELDDNEMFLGGAAFCYFAMFETRKIAFRKVSLEKCLFLETHVGEAQFIDVKWPLKGKCFKRKAVYDEVSPGVKWLDWEANQYKAQIGEPQKYDYSLIAQVYRWLQANYISNYRFPEAGDFYIGEREMMRKAKGKIRQFFCTDFLYLIISRYGESFTLPFLWLLLTLLAFPAILLFGGINLDYDSQITGLAETVNYDWTWSPKDLLLLKSDYWNTLAVNLSFVTFHRSEITTYLPQILQRAMVNLQILLVIALAAFFLLALRRKFKRKSF